MCTRPRAAIACSRRNARRSSCSQPDWRSRFLATITDPSVALILMMIGMYGLFFEFANPGMVLPGVAGAICLLVGLFALQLLPVSYVGLGLIVLGIGFLVAEMFLPTFGSLGIGGDHRVRDRRADADRYRRARLRHSGRPRRRRSRSFTALFVFVGVGRRAAGAQAARGERRRSDARQHRRDAASDLAHEAPTAAGRACTANAGACRRAAPRRCRAGRARARDRASRPHADASSR